MTRAEAIEKLKRWKLEVDDEKAHAEYLEGWFYKDDEIAFDMAIEALRFRDRYDQCWEEIKTAGKQGREIEIRHGGRLFKIREVAQ